MNEAETRTKLIDGELIKCGWNIKDITKVIEEYEIELDDDLPHFFDRIKSKRNSSLCLIFMSSCLPSFPLLYRSGILSLLHYLYCFLRL